MRLLKVKNSNTKMLSLAKFIKKYLFHLLNNFREIELRENLVGTGFIDPP